ELMAQKGFVIFALDNRGSAGRGHVFETPIYRHFCEKELSDQHDGVTWLKSQPWVDANRIGVWGWSYGGHMTLHLMFEDGADFKAGFAGGPVTDWHYYDSIYLSATWDCRGKMRRTTGSLRPSLTREDSKASC